MDKSYMSEDVSQINKRRVKNYKEGNSSLFILPKNQCLKCRMPVITIATWCSLQ